MVVFFLSVPLVCKLVSTELNDCTINEKDVGKYTIFLIYLCYNYALNLLEIFFYVDIVIYDLAKFIY